MPVDQRIKDLISRLTLEEKVAQMLNAAPAVYRLGFPSYDCWNETLNGVARTPYKATSYPQAIAMAATWNTSALQLMAEYSAIEGRTIYNKSVELNITGRRYVGLTYWLTVCRLFIESKANMK